MGIFVDTTLEVPEEEEEEEDFELFELFKLLEEEEEEVDLLALLHEVEKDARLSVARQTRLRLLPPEHLPEQQSSSSTQDSPTPARVQDGTGIGVGSKVIGFVVGAGLVGSIVGVGVGSGMVVGFPGSMAAQVAKPPNRCILEDVK